MTFLEQFGDQKERLLHLRGGHLNQWSLVCLRIRHTQFESGTQMDT